MFHTLTIGLFFLSMYSLFINMFSLLDAFTYLYAISLLFLDAVIQYANVHIFINFICFFFSFLFALLFLP